MKDSSKGVRTLQLSVAIVLDSSYTIVEHNVWILLPFTRPSLRIEHYWHYFVTVQRIFSTVNLGYKDLRYKKTRL
jgi:hypothetical protein